MSAATPGERPLAVEFDRTVDDLLAMNLFVYERSGLRKKHLASYLLLQLGVVALLACAAFVLTGLVLAAVVPAAVGAALVLVAFPPWQRRSATRAIRRELEKDFDRKAEMRRRFALEAGGLREEWAEGGRLTPYGRLEEVVRAPEHLFVVAGPLDARPIPRGAFRAEADAEAFAAELERRVREARGG